MTNLISGNDAEPIRHKHQSVLYITYDGLLEPLGQSQVLAYLERLAGDYDIHLLSFEKPADWRDAAQREATAARIRAAGIHWHPRRYHKRPTAPATAWDVLVGTVCGVYLVLRHRIRIVHERTYVPAVMALAIKRITGAKFLFDMRGFWPEERVDGGLWPPEGRLFRFAKWFERKFLLGADHVVSLTHAAVREMEQFDYLRDRMPPITVIPTCADFARFRPSASTRRGALTVGYVGTAGTWYRFDVTAKCFRELLALRPDTHFLIVNRNEHDYIREQLSMAGVPERCYELRSTPHGDIPDAMARMDASLFFLKPCYSKLASSPTRLGELLGCGVPCMSNGGVGDMAEVLEGERVGVAVDSFEAASLHAGLKRLLALLDEPDIRSRCVTAARKHFSLDEGVRRYDSIYGAMLGRS